MRCLVNVGIADVWSKPEFNSERMTQALFHEPVEVLERGQAFSLVQLGDGYTGHISNDFLTEADSQNEADYMVSASIAVAHAEADIEAPTVTILPFTAAIKVDDFHGEFASCTTKRYGDLFLAKDDIVPIEQTPHLSRDMIPLLLSSAKRFIGVPYLWGGKSFFGFDCSGFVQVNAKFFNVGLPRDTKDQIKVGREISRDAIKPGDLLFFERHVALAINSKDFIHSSLSQGGVHINSFDPTGPHYLERLDRGFKAARRIVAD